MDPHALRMLQEARDLVAAAQGVEPRLRGRVLDDVVDAIDDILMEFDVSEEGDSDEDPHAIARLASHERSPKT